MVKKIKRIAIVPIIILIISSELYLKDKEPIRIPNNAGGIIILTFFRSHFFQYIYKAIKSMTNKTGSKIAAATIGLILRDMIGIAKIAIGPAKPPFDIPNKTTPIPAVK